VRTVRHKEIKTMEHSDNQTPGAPATRSRGSGGDIQSKGVLIPEEDDAVGREEAGGDASPESSSDATAEE
jgi:hypothetical protein